MSEVGPRKTRARAQAPAAAKRAAAAPRVARWDFQTESLGYVLRRAQMRAFDLFFAMLDSAALSPARLTALSMIAIEPDIDQATLARRLRISGPSVVKIVDALEGAGLIARAACADDRRRYALVLVEAGRAKLDEVRAAWPRYESELTRGLDAAERRQLLALLRKVAGGDA
jgi:DNA-binding MarR family transcriptional regulator